MLFFILRKIVARIIINMPKIAIHYTMSEMTWTIVIGSISLIFGVMLNFIVKSAKLGGQNEIR